MKCMEYQGKQYIPIIDFMRMSKLARATIQKYIKNGTLKGVNIGCKYWIDEAEFQKYLGTEKSKKKSKGA